jgi:hypothetical protein
MDGGSRCILALFPLASDTLEHSRSGIDDAAFAAIIERKLAAQEEPSEFGDG